MDEQKYAVRLTYPACTDDTDTMIASIDAIGRPYLTAGWDAKAGTTTIMSYVLASSLAAALVKVTNEMAEVTALIGVEPDAAEVLSKRAHIESLGGPEALKRVQKLFRTE